MSSAPIFAAVRSNVSLRLIVVDPALKATENEHMSTLIRLCDARDERILLFQDLRFTAGADHTSQDAHEAHEERFRGVSR